MEPSPPRKQRDLFPGFGTPEHKSDLGREQDEDHDEHEDGSPRAANASAPYSNGVTSPMPDTYQESSIDGRKRQRNAMGVNNTTKAKAAVEFRGAIQDLYSDDSGKIGNAINVALVRSYDDANPVNLEEFPELLPALSYVLDLVNPVGSLVYTQNSKLTPEHLIYTDFHESPWPDRIRTELDDFFVIASRSLDENKLMEYVCTILQNLSFEQANEMLIVYNAPILRHLISLLYVDGTSGKYGEMYKVVELSYGVLSRCARFVDATGARRVEPDLFLVDAIDGKIMNSMGVPTVPLLSNNRNNLQHAYVQVDQRLLFGDKKGERYKEFFGQEATVMVVELIRGLFPLLLHRMHSVDRGTVLFSLELLSRLALSPENEKIFRAAPDRMYKKLVELLYVSTVGTDPFELASAKHPATDLFNQGSGTITDIVGFNGVEAKKIPACTMPITEMIDLEMRDYALDAMYNLCLLNQEFMVRRMVKIPNCVFYLQKIVETPAPATVKSEMNIPQKASSILNFMIADETLHSRLKCLRKDLYIGAAHDSVMAEFVSGPTLKLFFDDYDPPEDSPAFPLAGIHSFQGVGGDNAPRRGGNGSNQYVRKVAMAANEGEKDVGVSQPRLTLKLSMSNKRDRAAFEN